VSRAFLTRTVSFSAAHHYARSEWSPDRNREVFGASHTPHGHNYLVDVTVAGEVDPLTGFVIDLPSLDRLLREEVVQPLDQQDLNQAIPHVLEGGMVPTTENLARWLWERLHARIPPPATLVAVRVAEGPTLASEYRG